MEEIRPIKPDKDPLEEAREKEEELIKNAPPFTDFNEIEVDPVTHKIKIIEPKSEKQKIIEKEFEEEMRQLEAKYQSVMSEIKRTEDQMKARVQQGLSTDDRNRLEKMANYYDADSELAYLNRTASVHPQQVSHELYDMLTF